MALRTTFLYNPGQATVAYLIMRFDGLFWDFTSSLFTATPTLDNLPLADSNSGHTAGIYAVNYGAAVLPGAANQFLNGYYWVFLIDTALTPVVQQFSVVGIVGGDSALYVPAGGAGGGSLTDAGVQNDVATALATLGYSGALAAQLAANVDVKTSTRQAALVAVTLPSNPPPGYGGAGGGGTSDAQLIADVTTALVALGYSQALAAQLAGNVDAQVSKVQKAGVAVTLPPAPAGYGGATVTASAGTGTIPVTSSTGGTDALRYMSPTAPNTPVAGGTVWAYLAADFAAGRIGPAFVQAATATGPDGRISTPLLLNPGGWVLAFFVPDVLAPSYVPLSL